MQERLARVLRGRRGAQSQGSLDSNTWVSEVKCIRGKKQPLSAARLHTLRDKYTRTAV